MKGVLKFERGPLKLLHKNYESLFNKPQILSNSFMCDSFVCDKYSWSSSSTKKVLRTYSRTEVSEIYD